MASFTPGLIFDPRTPGTLRIGDWVDTRTILNALVKRKIFCSTRNQCRFLARPAGILIITPISPSRNATGHKTDQRNANQILKFPGEFVFCIIEIKLGI